MQKVKTYVCPIDKKAFKTLNGFGDHMRKFHPSEIPDGWSDARYFYYLQTGKRFGTCVVCKKQTDWNETTQKYNRFCNNPKCKDQYREEFKNRMIGKYGKVHLLDDPEQQRKMLANKKISGKYKFEDGGAVEYTGTYEKDFLMMLDKFMNLSSKDVMGPSPHTYYYFYRNPNDQEHQGIHFYIPDFYIPSLNLEIEIKQNTNTHPKLLAIDKVKEKQKDEVLITNKFVNYIKIVEKDYSDFFKYFIDLKESIDSDPKHQPAHIVPIKQSDIEATKDNIATESIMNNDISSVKDVNLFMSNNIKYSNFTKLLSAKEVLNNKKGDCHSQCNLEIYLLNKLNIHGNKLFFIEYNGNESTNAMTHTLVWYKANNKIYWIENAWENMRGIHGPYDSISNLKDEIVNIHNKMPSSKRYPKLKFASISYDKIGCSLSEYVSNNLNKENIATESMTSDIDKNYEPKGTKSLSSFTKKVCDDGEFDSWKQKFPSELKHVRCNENCIVTLWISGITNPKLVAYISIEKKSEEVCIQALEILPDFRSYGLGNGLMKYAKINGANTLYVNPNNKVAIKLYQNNGWKFANANDEHKLKKMVLD